MLNEYIIITLVAIAGSVLTLFSGFGLGTALVPVFGIFFPIEMAIALTAIVHFLNNLFKLLLYGKKTDKEVVMRFGIPSLIASFIGALVLIMISGGDPIYVYHYDGHTFSITLVKLVIASLLLVFVLVDLIPRFSKVGFDKKYLVAGGLLSGFFGGLSGTQGALRSAFLLKTGLTKEKFIATGVVIACMVDIARLTIYSEKILNVERSNYLLIIVATLAAFLGTLIGSRIIKKTTILFFRYFVAAALILFSLILGAGII